MTHLENENPLPSTKLWVVTLKMCFLI